MEVLALSLAKSGGVEVSSRVLDGAVVVSMGSEFTGLLTGVNKAVIEMIVEHAILLLRIEGLPKGLALASRVLLSVESANHQGLVNLAQRR